MSWHLNKSWDITRETSIYCPQPYWSVGNCAGVWSFQELNASHPLVEPKSRWKGSGILPIMHQSIPAAPSPPPPRATAGNLPAFSVSGVAHLQILRCQGAGHLPTRGNSRPLTRTRFPTRIELHRGYYWKKSRLAHLSRTGGCKGMF